MYNYLNYYYRFYPELQLYYFSQYPIFYTSQNYLPIQEGIDRLPINVEGSWKTNFGKMVLVQNGNMVNGTYEHAKGIIRGIIVGNILTGEWSQAPDYSYPRNKGTLRFEFSSNGMSFNGMWNYGPTPPIPSNYWNGVRI